MSHDANHFTRFDVQRDASERPARPEPAREALESKGL
jgi:hypothetical protein